MSPPPFIVGVAEVAHLFGVQPNTVEKWRQRYDDTPKPGPGTVSGNPWFYGEDWVRWGIDNNRTTR